MGLAELVTRLERDADARVDGIEARAREELAAIEKAQERASSDSLAAELATRRAARLAATERELSLARRSADRAVLRARREALDRVLARASELLEGANADPAYRATLGARVRAALGFVGSDAVVRCRADLAGALRDLGVAVREDPAIGAGFVVEAGAVRVDETLAARLERMRDAIVMELAAEISP